MDSLECPKLMFNNDVQQGSLYNNFFTCLTNYVSACFVKGTIVEHEC